MQLPPKCQLLRCTVLISLATVFYEEDRMVERSCALNLAHVGQARSPMIGNIQPSSDFFKIFFDCTRHVLPFACI